MAKLYTTLVFLLISIIHYVYLQNYDELIQPKCTGNTIKYSIIADIKNYLLSDNNNIDRRELYGEVDDLKTKKVGILKGTPITPGRFDNLISYEKINDLIRDIRNHKLDAVIVDNGVCNFTQAFGDDLSLLDGFFPLNFVGFAVQKDNITLLNEINELLGRNDSKVGQKKDWYGFDEEQKHIPKEQNGTKGYLKIMYRLEFPPYAYIEDGDPIGSEVGFIYHFTNEYGYRVNLSQSFTIQDQIDCLKNKTIDIAGGLLPILDEYKNDVSFSNVFHPSRPGMIIRYANHIEFDTVFYDSIKDFNGQSLGTLVVYSELTKSLFKDSEIICKDTFYELYIELLAERIEGIIIDKVIADYFNNRYPNRISFYTDILEENNYGFGFQKNKEGETLRNQFNEFLKHIDTNALYEKWLKTNSLQLHVNKTLNDTSVKTINYATTLDVIPTNYLEFGESKGFELDLVYMFAREYNYKVNFINLDHNDSDRIDYLLEGKANITGGLFTITEERKKIIHFSDIILESATILSCRTDSKKEYLTTHIVDNNYDIKPNNNVDIEVKFSNITKNASCIFPVKYNDTIIINCTIFNITEKNPFYEGFEYGNTTDKIRYNYYDFEANNFFKANTILPNKNIIIESDKSKVICHENEDDDKGNITNLNPKFYKKNSSKLGTGGIIAITICCAAVLLGVTFVSIFLPKKLNVPYEPSSSNTNLKYNS